MYTKREELIVTRPAPPESDNIRQANYIRKKRQFNADLDRYQRETEMLCEFIDLKPGMKVLEIGAGTGNRLLELANLGADCYDIDIVPQNIEFVQEIGRHYGFDIKAFIGDSCAMPFPDDTMDAIYSEDTFEHFYDEDLALREQLRVLKPGGRLAVVVGNLLNPKTFKMIFLDRFLQTRGREGGFRWLFTKHRARLDYGLGWHGKYEDFKSLWWWRRKMRSTPGVEVVELTTSRAHHDPDRFAYRLFEPFTGCIVLAARKL